jgi:hypothetical protein
LPEPTSTSALRARLIAGATLCALALVVYAPLLLPDRAPYSAYSDILAEHLALKQVGYESWSKHHSWPLWREDQLAGAPALTNPQALYLHPLHAAFWFVSPLAALGPTLVLQFLVAAFGCYLLARSLGASRFGAVFSGAASLVSYKSILAAHAGWLAPLATLAVLPLWIAGLVRLCERASSARAWQLAAISAVACGGGSPQLLYYAGLLCLPFLFWTRRLPLCGACVALGAACHSYLWLTVLGDWPLLTRGQAGDYVYFLSGNGLGLADFGSLVSPQLSAADQEPWERSAYFGVLPLALALWAALCAPARSRQTYAAAALAISAAVSLDSPVLRVLHAYFPLYASFRLPGRMLFVTSCLGIALAGCGFDRALAQLRARLPRAAAGVAAALVLAVIIEGMSYVQTYLPTTQASALLPDASHPARSLDPAPAAIAGRDTLNYGWSTALGLRLINGYDPYQYAHYRRYMTLLQRGAVSAEPDNWIDVASLARPDLLDELGVRHVLASQAIPLPQLRMRTVAPAVRNFVFYTGMTEQPLYVHENTTARAFVRFASAAVGVSSSQEVEQRMLAEPLHGQAFVPELFPPFTPDAQASVQIARHTPGALRLSTQSRTRQLLVIAQSYHPGWRVRIDGHAGRALQVNMTLLGTWVESGQHYVELRFEPPYFGIGVIASIIALALLLGWSLLLGATLLRR